SWRRSIKLRDWKMPDWKAEVRKRLSGLQLAPARENAIVEELAQHLDESYAELLASGVSEADAYRHARAELRDGGLLTHGLRRVERSTNPEPIVLGTNQRTNMIADLWQDLRFGARMLAKQPGFSLIAVFTLALGIGANTAIFSGVDGLLLRPLPYPEPERLVWLTNKTSRDPRTGISYPNFSDWRDRAQSFEGMAAFRSESFNLTGVEKAVRLRGRTVNWNLFKLLGIQPQLGRLFIAEDDRYGAPGTVLLSHGMWQEKFGGAADVIGKKLTLSGEVYEVIGVLPPGFEYFSPTDVFTPIGLLLKPKTGMTDRGTSMGLTALAR